MCVFLLLPSCGLQTNYDDYTLHLLRAQTEMLTRLDEKESNYAWTKMEIVNMTLEKCYDM